MECGGEGGKGERRSSLLAGKRLEVCWLRGHKRDLELRDRSHENGDVAANATTDTSIALACSPLAPLDKALPHMMLQHHDGVEGESYASLIDRLVARFGYGAVVRLAPQACWQPEVAQSFELPDPKQIFTKTDEKSGWLGDQRL